MAVCCIARASFWVSSKSRCRCSSRSMCCFSDSPTCWNIKQTDALQAKTIFGRNHRSKHCLQRNKQLKQLIRVWSSRNVHVANYCIKKGISGIITSQKNAVISIHDLDQTLLVFIYGKNNCWDKCIIYYYYYSFNWSTFKRPYEPCMWWVDLQEQTLLNVSTLFPTYQHVDECSLLGSETCPLLISQVSTLEEDKISAILNASLRNIDF